MQGHEELAIPHVSVPDIRWVDWKAVKRAGFEGAAFDKDNTLTLPYIEKVDCCSPVPCFFLERCRAAGFEGAAFDKDSTLTLLYIEKVSVVR